MQLLPPFPLAHTHARTLSVTYHNQARLPNPTHICASRPRTNPTHLPFTGPVPSLGRPSPVRRIPPATSPRGGPRGTTGRAHETHLEVCTRGNNLLGSPTHPPLRARPPRCHFGRVRDDKSRPMPSSVCVRAVNCHPRKRHHLANVAGTLPFVGSRAPAETAKNRSGTRQNKGERGYNRKRGVGSERLFTFPIAVPQV